MDGDSVGNDLVRSKWIYDNGMLTFPIEAEKVSLLLCSACDEVGWIVLLSPKGAACHSLSPDQPPDAVEFRICESVANAPPGSYWLGGTLLIRGVIRYKIRDFN